MFFCLETDGSDGSHLEMGGFNVFLFRNGWVQRFSVKELKVPNVPYLEMCSSHVFRLETDGSDGSQFRNGRFQCFPV